MERKSRYDQHLPEILRLKSEGLRGDQIAATLKISYSSMVRYLRGKEVHFPKGAWQRKALTGIEDLVRDGLTQSQIAERLGVHLATIERRCKKMDLRTGRTGPRAASHHREWRGGRRLDKHGYILVYVPLHPRSRKQGYLGEHILLAEVSLGRMLQGKEVVHHEDDHPRSNWPGNLFVYAGNADHLKDELTGRVKATPRRSIPGAYRSTVPLDHCPSEEETLALCHAETRAKLAWYIESFRPTIEHRNLSRRLIRRTGAWRDPFLSETTE